MIKKWVRIIFDKFLKSDAIKEGDYVSVDWDSVQSEFWSGIKPFGAFTICKVDKVERSDYSGKIIGVYAWVTPNRAMYFALKDISLYP